MTAEQALNALEHALDHERSALIASDADALMQANEAKLAALRQLEAMNAEEQWYPQLKKLMERNRANGVLLARRQREMRWALRHLGRSDSNNSYGADGRVSIGAQGRSFGQA